MQLIDMKNTVKTKDSSLVSPMEQDEYPYGLRISLNNDTLKKLGLAELPAIGSEHKLMAMVSVVSLSSNESAGEAEPYRSVDLQIEKMVLMPKEASADAPRDPAKAMYPSMLG